MNEHVGENAELYALGLLDTEERIALERHIAGCATCLGRVGAAEGTASSLAAPLPRLEPSGALRERLLASAAEPVSMRGVARAGRMAARLARERAVRGRLSLFGRLAAVAMLLL